MIISYLKKKLSCYKYNIIKAVASGVVFHNYETNYSCLYVRFNVLTVATLSNFGRRFQCMYLRFDLQ